MGVPFGQDDETNLKRVSLYTVLFQNNFSLYKYTVVFGNERSICLLENRRKEKENTRKEGKKNLEIAPTPALMLYEGLGPKSMCACQIYPDFQNGYRRAQRSKEKKIAPELGKSLEQNSRKPLKSF